MQRGRKYTLDESVFENIDTEEKAYWLGFILADGCITTLPKSYLQIDLKLADEGLLDQFQSFLKSNYPLYDSKNKCNEKVIWSKRLKINSYKLVSDIVSHGITPRKSLTSSYLITKFDRDFIRGIFDGDGTISRSTDSNCLAIYGTKQLVTSIQNVIYKAINTKNNKIWHQGNMFAVRWRSYSDINKIYNYFYDNAKVYLPRKKDKFEQILLRRKRVI